MLQDILGRFQGDWHLYPVRNSKGEVVGTRGVLEQDILPKGVPPFFAHMPVLGGLLRRVSLNAISRLVEDITLIVDRVRGFGAGLRFKLGKGFAVEGES
jgi:hypothetical protein